MKKQMTKQKIYEKGLELFRRKDYDQVTVDDICKEIQITKPTFYHHCPAKEDILTKAYSVDYSGIQPGWNECPDGNYIASIIRGMDVLMVRVFELEPYILRAFLQAKLKNPDLESPLDPVWMDQMHELIKKAADSKQIPIEAGVHEIFEMLMAFALGYSFYFCTEKDVHSSPAVFHKHIYGLLSLKEPGKESAVRAE